MTLSRPSTRIGPALGVAALLALSSCTINLNSADQRESLAPEQQDYISCDIWINRDPPFPLAHIRVAPSAQELEANVNFYRQNLKDLEGLTTLLALQVTSVQEDLFTRTLARLETGETLDYDDGKYPSAAVSQCHRILGLIE